MGFGMCTNIHAKINPDDQLFICDINQAALERFLQESKGEAKVAILPTPKDVAEQCVSRNVPTTVSSTDETDQLIQGHHHNNATPKRTRATGLLRRRQQPALRVRINARNETLPRMQHHRPSSNARSGKQNHRQRLGRIRRCSSFRKISSTTTPDALLIRVHRAAPSARKKAPSRT